MKQLSILLLLFISGCSLTPAVNSNKAELLWQKHQESLKTLNKWRLNASLSVTKNKQNWIIRVLWDQDGDNYTLRLNAPLGQGAALLTGTKDGVIMRTGNNETFEAKSADELVVQALNMELPIENLYYWVRGIPAPDHRILQYDLYKNGHLNHLEQSGWAVEYSPYVEVENILLPKKIYLDHKDIEVKIVITKWNI
ncbi:lipoprotein insertase outer membrane protein LolB [Candidatus Marithrix sp. Canyon 246]|uniref:lipoprotein insertase outer membrane protein LolB n=1 Tax=Candidatus Marithrix sp. Canyon 246 TaxID=1827136 RepID=UPI00084A1072|nr:lipoprotein insertase outer membrane protein LolB [Candidatus Marithrix sp. Canyon 246]